MPTLTFGLADEDFWTQPKRTLKATQEKARESDFLGILLEGPRAVDLERRATLPLIGLRRATLEDNFFLRHDSHAVIAAVSDQDQSVFAAPAFLNKSEEPEDYTPPEEGFPEGTRMSALEIDARERLPDLPWAPGAYTFTLYLFDRQSNPVRVEFQDGRPPRDGAAEAHARIPRTLLPAPDPEAGHSFVKTAESPGLPAGEGIALKADHRIHAYESPACMLRGSFRLKALAGERLDARPGEALPDGAEGAEAIVSIPLLLIGKDIAGPYLFHIQAPARASSEAGMVEGYFNVNLLRMPESFGIPQAYAARAQHGRFQSAVVKFELEKATAQ